jgi:AcrR family transcriptional regulator
MQEAPRPRSHRPAEERRAQILEAALACFARKGFHAATMDDLVRASGLSKGSLYWHFASKQEVFLALFEDFSEWMFDEWDRLLSEGHATVEALEQVTLGSLERMGGIEGLGAWVEFFAHPQARARFAAVYRQTRARLEASLRRDMEAGRLRSQPEAAPGLAAALTAAAEGLMLQAMVDAEFDLRANWLATRDMIRRGIEA